MPASVVQSSANNNGAGATTLVLTLSASQAGEALAVRLGARAAHTIAAGGVSDNVNATTGWVIINPSGARNPDAISAAIPAFAYNLLGTAGVTTIMVTLDSSGVAGGCASRLSGVNGFIDAIIGSNGEIAVTSWDSHGVVAAAACLALGLSSAGGSGLTFTAGSGWAADTGTNLTAGSNTNGTDNDQIFFENQRFASGGTYNATGTSTSVSQHSGVMLFTETPAGGGTSDGGTSSRRRRSG